MQRTRAYPRTTQHRPAAADDVRGIVLTHNIVRIRWVMHVAQVTRYRRTSCRHSQPTLRAYADVLGVIDSARITVSGVLQRTTSVGLEARLLVIKQQ